MVEFRLSSLARVVLLRYFPRVTRRFKLCFSLLEEAEKS